MKPSINEIQKDVVRFLNENLPKHFTYHNIKHTLYVYEKAIHIANKEKVNSQDIALLKIAALYHDIGFTKSHLEHEKASCEIAKKQLKNYGYSKEDIHTICGMIMATKIPQSPKNLLEQILADADLEYLATSKYLKTSTSLYQELLHFNPDLSEDDWIDIQIKFIKNHRYHTSYCKRYKTFRKNKNLALLESTT
ncbi:HD domain-containing protein [Lacinutrix sp. WUR7]|uniref:HD domain-containing protein n=1 Tax=Lacinutrix sp. WUR7 TaxID=2653681 RepID=UPI00193DA15C|nr:HD domain-containing protein [Lacinutrix sp. WUR7]QRM89045.1 HD domain-containing protein [Lacinutrix sp. WUR7]